MFFQLNMFQKTGDVRINGRLLRKFSCYVQQLDLFCGTLTVREELIYSVGYGCSFL